MARQELNHHTLRGIMTIQGIQAKPTEYAGLLFRSRLEARYAAMLDILKADWEYEPDDFDGYIPDFKIHVGKAFTYLEIKPGRTVEELEPAMHKAISVGLYGHCHGGQSPHGTIAVIGSQPYIKDECYTVSGLYAEDCLEELFTDPCTLAVCMVCNRFGWTSSYNSFVIVPCGHYQDSGGWHEEPVQDAWAAAQRKVQWRPIK